MCTCVISFEDFLLSQRIKIINENNESKIKENLCETMVFKQFELLSDFHYRTMNFNGILINNLENHTGRIIEEYKIDMKRLKKDIIRLNDKPENKFEEVLNYYGYHYFNRAQKCINTIYDKNYIDILKRSMLRREVCLRCGEFNNLKRGKDSDAIIISDCNYCEYNFVEIDCYYILKRLRKDYDFDWSKLIHEFCQYEKLDKNSDIFLHALLSYPYEFMKCCNRYRKNKKNWSYDKYARKLQKAIIQDGCSLI